MKDRHGNKCTIKASRGDTRGFTGYSIVRRTRRGVKFLEAEWLPTRNSAEFMTKREAVKFIQAHEDISYGLS